jgi:ketosteroid isomerase-like protein
MSHSFFLVIALALSCFASPQASRESANVRREPSITLPPELARVLTDYEVAWRAKDAAALARLFAEGGFVLPDGGPMIRGRQAIQNFYHGSGGPLSLRAVAYAVDGNVGYIIGAFARRSSDPDIGKFTLTLKKDGTGQWLIMSDMDNGNPVSKAPATAFRE